MTAQTVAPAIEGWFTLDDKPRLLGNRCTTCGTVFFPQASIACRNPDCTGTEFEVKPLSRSGTIWSYTDARYQPPPPYVPREEDHVPFAIAAVELEAEGMVVLGQVADGYDVDDLAIGMPVELVVEELYGTEATSFLVWKWRPTGDGG